MLNIRERLDKILDIIQAPSFLENKGLGNEIGFYIFDYDPKDELLVRDHIRYLKQVLSNDTSQRKVVEFDLFELLLEFLKREGAVENIPILEEEQGTEYLLEALRDVANPEVYVNYIQSIEQNYQVVFITGVGKVWPVVRSHNILNNLHHVLDQVPVIMFFPGSYDGAELRLFNRMKDDNYYRAFRLVEK